MVMEINFIEDIIIIDNLFSKEEILSLENLALQLEDYRLTTDTTKRLYTFTSFPEEDNKIVQYLLKKFEDNFNFKIPKFDRVLVNLFKHLDFCDTHKDADSDDGISFLVYLNSEWHQHWGGDTYFSKKENPDFTISVIPKPGRIVISPSYLYHGSRPPTILMDCIARLTAVFQYTGKEGRIDIYDILESFMENNDVEI